MGLFGTNMVSVFGTAGGTAGVRGGGVTACGVRVRDSFPRAAGFRQPETGIQAVRPQLQDTGRGGLMLIAAILSCAFGVDFLAGSGLPPVRSNGIN